ncbi:hypothetical protein DO021_00665 [Desulfobacter hydrogenophilus]|uniref:Hsp20/alpha crystallin family protein n=1 Tax=Desulfobacter hydrogenophilus TaxID=2291 RepID=A0A328FLQ0_9BACT|nr:Hsp20/alpha crystallin family protein [Desulfobacter hydrogenophilus]QBH12983.1 Hsp20/alpha crystallin family protein [Desulfobacter hydrogenophilus]RAM03967.1 hypothetical protein DO021_00665 [Desulfobacter hydrogenophilus]
MPVDANQSKVDARFKNGILNIIIPRSKTRASRANQIKDRGLNKLGRNNAEFWFIYKAH